MSCTSFAPSNSPTHGRQTNATSKIAKSLETLPDPILRRRARNAFRCRSKSTTTRSAKKQPIAYVAQDNQYDIDFLLSRARRIGYVIFVKEEEQENGRVTKQRRLYFGPSDANHPGLRRVTFRTQMGRLAH